MTLLCRRAQDNAPIASYWLSRVILRRAPRLDESIVQGVLGAKPACHICSWLGPPLAALR